MSDWDRYGRDEDRRRHGFDERERRNLEAGAPYDEADWRERERRSFGGERPGQGYGQGYGQAYERRGAYAQPAAEPRYGRADDLRQGYGRGASRVQPRYGHEGVFGGNEWLERYSDGDDGANFAGHHFTPHGEHRGRGPKNYTRSDERIHEDVSDRLSDDSWLDASEIEVKVANGEVTLSGAVASREDKRRAEDLAEGVSGVRHVQNNVRLQPQAAGSQIQATAPATFGRPLPVRRGPA